MTISWTLTAGGLASEAASRVQMIGQGQTLTGHRWNRAKAHINAMLKLLQTQGDNRWRRSSQSVTLVQDQASYTLNPRPDVVREAFFVTTATGYERAMGAPWNFDDYERIPIKTQSGHPNVYSVDRQRTQTDLYVWPRPDATAAANHTIRVLYERVIEDVEQPADIVDVPQEWLDCLADVLGGRLATDFRIENPSAQEVKARGAASFEALLGHDSEESITFTL